MVKCKYVAKNNHSICRETFLRISQNLVLESVRCLLQAMRFINYLKTLWSNSENSQYFAFNLFVDTSLSCRLLELCGNPKCSLTLRYVPNLGLGYYFGQDWDIILARIWDIILARIGILFWPGFGILFWPGLGYYFGQDWDINLAIQSLLLEIELLVSRSPLKENKKKNHNK